MKGLGCLDKSLLSKLSWQFTVERWTFWNNVITGKYGEVKGGGTHVK